MDTSFLEAGASSVHSILTASKEKTEELQKATSEDSEILFVMKYIRNGWPTKSKHLLNTLKPYWDKRSELHFYKGLLFLGNKLVIPKQMRQEVLEKLHVAHQGITSCQRKARKTVYWPN